MVADRKDRLVEELGADFIRRREYYLQGAGAPAFTADEGTRYWDTVGNDLYVNDAGINTWQHIGGGGVAVPHQLLDNPWHTDTTTAAPVRGDVITAQGVAPTRWNRVAHPGAAAEFFRANAADPGWAAIVAGDLPNLGGVPALTYGVANAGGVAATYVRTDASLAVFDVVVPDVIQCDDAAATGAQPFAARRDHTHGIVCVAPVNIGVANAEGVATSFPRSDHIHNHPAGLGTGLHHTQTHNLLSADHPDTTPAGVAQGDLITGQAGPTWAVLSLGASCSVLHSDGTDVEWSTLAGLNVVTGTGANTQVTYWIGVNTVAGDAGLTYNAGTDTLTVGAIDVATGGDVDPADASGQDLGDATHRWDLYTQEVYFGGATGTNVITLIDNLANALYIVDDGDGDVYLQFVTTTGSEEVIFNAGGDDVDFTIQAVGVADALQVRGADGQVTLGVLGAGFVQSTAGGILSSAAIAAGDLPAHTHAGAGQGGQLDWDDVWTDAVHSHANAGEGGQLDWDLVWTDAVHDHSAAGEGGEIPLASLGGYTQGDLIYGGAADWQDLAIGGIGDFLWVNAAGTEPEWHTLVAGNIPAHVLLGAQHSDTTTDAPTRGSLIYANSTPLWDELVIGADGAALYSDATDVAWTLTPTWKGDHTWDDGVGDSPAVRFIPQNNDVWTVFAENDGTAGNSDLVVTMPAADADAKFIWRSSTPADVAYVDAAGNADFAGHVAVGAAAAIVTSQTLRVSETYTTTAAITVVGIQSTFNFDPGANFATTVYGVRGYVTIDTAFARTGGTIVGVRGDVVVDGGATATALELRGVVGSIDVEDAAAGVAAAGRFITPAVDAGSCASGYGVSITQGAVGAGFVTTLVGLHIAAITVGNTNYAIYSAGGDSYMNGALAVGGTVAAAAQGHFDNAGAVVRPVLYLDQGDASEQHIVCSSDGNDVDFPAIIELDVTGSPTLWWDESEDAFGFKNVTGLIVEDADWIGSSGTTARLGFDSSGATDFAYFMGCNVGIETATIPHGGVGIAKFAVEGTNASAAGPHVQYTTASDDYPLFQQLNWTHDNIALIFDGYHDGGAWRSSDAGSNLQIYKLSDHLQIRYDNGIAQGAVITWNDGITLVLSGATAGNVGIGEAAPSQALDLIGSLELENTTTSTTGVIYKVADRFIHNFQHPTGDTAVPDGDNTFVGVDAGNFTMGATATQVFHGSHNTAIGVDVFQSNTIGYYNTAIGKLALFSNTEGFQNAALGGLALNDNTTGYRNTAVGYNTGRGITTGDYNTILGANVIGLAANLSNTVIIADGAGTQRIYIDSNGYVTIPGAAAAGLAQLHIDQSGAAGAIPVILMDQGDDDEPFYKLIGDGAADDSKNLSDASFGAWSFIGMYRIEIEDNQAVIASGDYWVPIYEYTA